MYKYKWLNIHVHFTRILENINVFSKVRDYTVYNNNENNNANNNVGVEDQPKKKEEGQKRYRVP